MSYKKINGFKNNYNILNPLKPSAPIILTNKYIGVRSKNEKPFINPSNTKNPFDEEKFVLEIYSELDKKNYEGLYQILNRLPTFMPIYSLYFSFTEKLREYNYTIQQLLAIAQLLYRLSNLNFVNVKSPMPFPQHSFSSIANILKNRELKNSTIDIKIKEIVKNLISHYNIDIKSNNKYNNTNTGKLALKLQNILLSFIIEYTKPESSEPLSVKSAFPRGATINQMLKIAKNHPEMMPRIIGNIN